MKILVVDDEKSIRVALTDELEEAGYDVTPCASGEEALALLPTASFDLVITDLIMGATSGLDLLDFIKGNGIPSEVLLITAHATVETARDALKKGAIDYVCKPFEIDGLLHIIRGVRETIRLKRENEELKSRLIERHRFHNIIGRSPVMQRVFDLLQVVSETDKTVLVAGETGTGKDLVAEAIHYNGPRRDRPFISVSCAALSQGLLESELFGHEKGSFTGAIKEKKGRFELAHTGTLFLDEIDDIPLDFQVKLLRVIQDGSFERVGSEVSRRVDTRIIAATKHDLWELVEEGRFRRDLYYRLNVIQIILPPLRERKEDIPLLIEHFLKKYAPGRTIDISPEIMELFMQFNWDGNVRELEHMIERMVLLAKDGTVDKNALSPKIRDYVSSNTEFVFERMKLPDYLFDMEKRILEEGLRRSLGSKTKAADTLGVPLPTLKSKLKKFGLS
jgi:DNA-binding NtrC family response regulator